VKKSSARQRLDQALLERGLVESRQKAQGLILAGEVSVNGNCVSKAGFLISAEDQISIKTGKSFVSRGGLKLAGALDAFPVMEGWLRDKVVLDLGASTGGFTQVLLEKKIQAIYALDVGYGQLHPKLASDPRVKVLDRKNARQITLELFTDFGAPDFFTADLSFISLTKILPVIKEIFPLLPGLILIKPQFELERDKNIKGVVKNWQYRMEAIRRVAQEAVFLGYQIAGIASSPILGPKGNQEFWMLISDPKDLYLVSQEFLAQSNDQRIEKYIEKLKPI
jgi:23S rRNA (cytidine1920-2'-O)/16S rRNA (cytidine1409-2'-O)-methyltransferase